jgi:penicillin G amidase
MKRLFTVVVVIGLVFGLSQASIAGKFGDTGQIVIKRDTYGVPHIYAQKVYGLFFGYGYAIAQDRLFQLEMIRRSAQGRVAEVLGAAHLAFDIGIRTNFKPESIKTQIENLSRKDKDVLEGYADGINAYLEEIQTGPSLLMPKQFIDFGFEPEPWTAYDVAMIYVGTMINRFGDLNSELDNLYILQTLIGLHGEETAWDIFDQLIPTVTTKGAPTSIPEGEWTIANDGKGKGIKNGLALASLQGNQKMLLPDEANHVAFSNCVLIGKDKADGANAILVGGPQFGYFNPSYVYSVGLHGAGFDVVGNAPFGYPVVMFGYNKHIAWGSTYGAGDHIDIYVETLNPGNPYEYLFNGSFRPMEKRTETIKVKGADDYLLDVYRTIHGPVIAFNFADGTAYSKKRSWEGLELDQLFGWVDSTKATNWNSWLREVYRTAQSVHLFYADHRGNIGHFYAGKFPERQPGHDGRLPASGEGDMEWIRLQSPDTNPKVYNPSQGFIANWNNSPAAGYPGTDTWWYFWGKADRVQVYLDALKANDRFTEDEAWGLIRLASFADINARYFIPWIQAAFEGVTDEPARTIVDTLVAWDYQSRDENGDGKYDELATAVSRTFLPKFLSKSLSDDLGSLFGWFGGANFVNLGIGTKVLVESLEEPEAQKFDFFNGDDPKNIIRAALEEAIAQLETTYGGDLENWRVPVATMTFSYLSFFGIPQAGSDESIVLSPLMNRGTQNNMVVFGDKGSKIAAYEVTPPGQSGFIAPDGTNADHYGDQVDLYSDFGRKGVWLDKKDVDNNLESVFHLR